MKVILTKDVSGLGRAGDVKEVSDGHARNFLLPKHLVLPATISALGRVQKEESERQDKVKKHEEKLLAAKSKLENKTFIVKGKAEKQHLFAAIHENQIVAAINEKLNLDIESNQIVLEKPIKSLGLHEFHVRLGEKQLIKVKLDVEAV
ncbi:MAG: 50S ribosomal protein L9 [Candidatus Doudnabacteria bacterium]